MDRVAPMKSAKQQTDDPSSAPPISTSMPKCLRSLRASYRRHVPGMLMQNPMLCLDRVEHGILTWCVRDMDDVTQSAGQADRAARPLEFVAEGHGSSFRAPPPIEIVLRLRLTRTGRLPTNSGSRARTRSPASVSAPNVSCRFWRIGRSVERLAGETDGPHRPACATDPFQRQVHVCPCSSVKAIFGHPCNLRPREPRRCWQARQVPIMVPTCAKRATVGLVPRRGTRFRLHNFQRASLGSNQSGAAAALFIARNFEPGGPLAYCQRPFLLARLTDAPARHRRR